IHIFTVTPSLPQELERQRALVYNLRWAWNHNAIELFRWDRDLWEQSGHNPALMLGMIDQGTLKAAAEASGTSGMKAAANGALNLSMLDGWWDEAWNSRAIPMRPVGGGGDGRYRFEVSSVACGRSELNGFTVRALPRHPDLIEPFVPGLIVWAQADESRR